MHATLAACKTLSGTPFTKPASYGIFIITSFSTNSSRLAKKTCRPSRCKHRMARYVRVNLVFVVISKSFHFQEKFFFFASFQKSVIRTKSHFFIKLWGINQINFSLYPQFLIFFFENHFIAYVGYNL